MWFCKVFLNHFCEGSTYRQRVERCPFVYHSADHVLNWNPVVPRVAAAFGSPFRVRPHRIFQKKNPLESTNYTDIIRDMSRAYWLSWGIVEPVVMSSPPNKVSEILYNYYWFYWEWFCYIDIHLTPILVKNKEWMNATFDTRWKKIENLDQKHAF